jgi:hypothetical protein
MENAVIPMSISTGRQKMISHKQRWLVASLVGLLCLGSVAYVAAQTTTVMNTNVRRMSAKVAIDRVCRTLATTLETIPDTTVEFDLTSNTPQEVLVTFTAAWPKPLPSDIPPGSQAAGALIFLFIDDQRVDIVSESAGGVLVHEGTATSVSNGTHSFTFVTEPISPGPHVARIAFLDNVLGPFGVPNGTICVGERSTVVQHR